MVSAVVKLAEDHTTYMLPKLKELLQIPATMVDWQHPNLLALMLGPRWILLFSLGFMVSAIVNPNIAFMLRVFKSIIKMSEMLVHYHRNKVIITLNCSHNMPLKWITRMMALTNNIYTLCVNCMVTCALTYLNLRGPDEWPMQLLLYWYCPFSCVEPNKCKSPEDTISCVLQIAVSYISTGAMLFDMSYQIIICDLGVKMENYK